MLEKLRGRLKGRLMFGSRTGLAILKNVTILKKYNGFLFRDCSQKVALSSRRKTFSGWNLVTLSFHSLTSTNLAAPVIPYCLRARDCDATLIRFIHMARIYFLVFGIWRIWNWEILLVNLICPICWLRLLFGIWDLAPSTLFLFSSSYSDFGHYATIYIDYRMIFMKC